MGDIISTLAKRNDLDIAISPELASIAVEHIDQTNESDLNLLTRLGKLHGAIATIKANRLLFTPPGYQPNRDRQADTHRNHPPTPGR